MNGPIVDNHEDCLIDWDLSRAFTTKSMLNFEKRSKKLICMPEHVHIYLVFTCILIHVLSYLSLLVRTTELERERERETLFAQNQGHCTCIRIIYGDIILATRVETRNKLARDLPLDLPLAASLFSVSVNTAVSVFN